MNLYFRLLYSLLTLVLKKRISIFDEQTTSHIVWPNDLDLLGHMNNGRYFTVTDIVRVEMLKRAGIWRELRKRKLIHLMAGETVQFRKPLNPFQRYTITTSTLGWDRKFFYVQHNFSSARQIHALMLVKVRVVGKDGLRVSPKEVLGFVHAGEIEDVRLGKSITDWNGASREHWKTRKRASKTSPADAIDRRKIRPNLIERR